MGSVKGTADVIAELRSKGGRIEEYIAAETENAAYKIEKDAKIYAPKNFGKLAQSISVAQSIANKGQTWVVTVNELYGGFMEFGTGAKVRIPDEFKDMAASFKGGNQGTFKEGLENIKVWCRAKGIDEKAAYPIFAKILGVGVNPQPFLYPAWIKGKKEYLDNLTKLLKNFK